MLCCLQGLGRSVWFFPPQCHHAVLLTDREGFPCSAVHLDGVGGYTHIPTASTTATAAPYSLVPVISYHQADQVSPAEHRAGGGSAPAQHCREALSVWDVTAVGSQSSTKSWSSSRVLWAWPGPISVQPRWMHCFSASVIGQLGVKVRMQIQEADNKAPL